MTIDPDVHDVAKQFGLDARLLQALVHAEGNIVRAVQCSIPSVTTRDAALAVACRSLVHAMCDYLMAHDPDDYVRFFAARWAPIGVANDPHDLNRHLPDNVLQGWLAQRVHSGSGDPPKASG